MVDVGKCGAIGYSSPALITKPSGNGLCTDDKMCAVRAGDTYYSMGTAGVEGGIGSGNSVPDTIYLSVEKGSRLTEYCINNLSGPAKKLEYVKTNSGLRLVSRQVAQGPASVIMKQALVLANEIYAAAGDPVVKARLANLSLWLQGLAK